MNAQHIRIAARYTSRGLSIVEALIVVALFTILMLAIMNAVNTFYSFNTYTISQSYQVQNARSGVERLVRDMREMTYADNGAYPLVSYSDTALTFYSDVDRDESVERVTYTLATTTLTKERYEATGTPPVYADTAAEITTVSEYVQNITDGVPIFTYYTSSGAVATSTTPVTEIRLIDISLIVNVDPVRDPGEFTLRSSAMLRNLKE